ncbi:MAG: NADP(H)-dependent aldo-keto reductase [Candidatus Cloacimonadota bacterium]|nr:MAG: NADP(H)-dependent aldo-keto reductase [Candidatus Cloacimonadota bacterium]
MKYTTLGDTKLKVSKICLGTMTYGEQNTIEEAHEQMDYALEQGVNFFDTAELYAIPPKKETQGKTEEFIGKWFQSRKNRDKIVLASKIAGPAEWVSHIRNGSGLDKTNITQAVESSLSRLQTDYIDLYQLHWPARNTNFFGVRGIQNLKDQETQIEDSIHETLSALKDLINAGKIKAIGLSNETPFGVMKFLELAKYHNLPRVQTIQNPYSLLNRSYEVGLAEISLRENCLLLPYSPLGFGVLSGKYLNGQNPKDARLTLYKGYERYRGPNGILATQEYVDLAKFHNISPSQMALSYVNTRSFVCSNIIGATKLEQLKENIASINVDLSDEVLEAIEAIQDKYPNPAP